MQWKYSWTGDFGRWTEEQHLPRVTARLHAQQCDILERR